MAVDNPADKAVDIFLSGGNCAQAVLGGFGPLLGLDAVTALRVSQAFGGGLARTAGLCGAVTGGMMVIGLAHARLAAGQDEERETCYRLARELMRRFQEQHGSLLCRELLGCDISTGEGMAAARARRFHTDICPRFVVTSCVILEELLGIGDA